MADNRLVRVTAPPRPSPPRQGYLVRGTIAPVFVEQGALSPEDAIAFVPAGGHMREWERLLGSGAIRQANEGWWLDMVAYRAAADARSRAALPWLIGGSVLIALIAMLFYQG